MKRIIWTSCIIVVLQTLTGCCSCCDMNRGAQCYSNCVPCNNGCGNGGMMLGSGSPQLSGGTGCCGDTMDYSLPPSPYATQQFGVPQQFGQQRIRVRQRTVGPAYSAAPYVDMGTQMGNGGMYESFGSEVLPDTGVPQTVPNDAGWQPKAANPLTPPAVPESAPSAYSTPSPIPAMSASQIQVPAPPSVPQTTSNLVGPDMGPTPPPVPEPVSQMGYRRQVPIQRAF